jgi:hypothetical protein
LEELVPLGSASRAGNVSLVLPQRSSAHELAQLVKKGIELSALLLELAVDLADAVGPWVVRQALDVQQPILRV